MRDKFVSGVALIFVAYANVATGFSFFSDDCVVPPKLCPNDNITFYLYTKSTADSPTKMTVKDPNSIRNAPLIPDAPLKFLVHGYTGHKDYTPNMEIRPAYFQSTMNVNILSIDYSPLVQEGCYLQAVANVDLIGKCAAQFLDTFLDLRPDVTVEHVHVIAMSLGAHVASQFKRFLKHGLLPRITGLDAAAPLFYAYITPEERHLNKGDAIVVDAIHTDGRFKGKYLPYADIDFYVNGGFSQPDCGFTQLMGYLDADDDRVTKRAVQEGYGEPALLMGYLDADDDRVTKRAVQEGYGEPALLMGYLDADDDRVTKRAVQEGYGEPDDSCSHARAAEIYAESITSKYGFWGYECSFYTRPLGACNGVKINWNIVGENTYLQNAGTFFIDTNKHPPFAQGLPPAYLVDDYT